MGIHNLFKKWISLYLILYYQIKLHKSNLIGSLKIKGIQLSEWREKATKVLCSIGHWIAQQGLEHFRTQDVMDSKVTKILRSNTFLWGEYITRNSFEQGRCCWALKEKMGGGVGERIPEGAFGKRLADLILTLLIVNIYNSLLWSQLIN